MPNARAHLFVSGRVQGVFYRAFTEEIALSHNLAGWVRNLPDGRVETIFEGERESITSAILECKKGPPYSRVAEVEVEWGEYKGEFGSFTVRVY